MKPLERYNAMLTGEEVDFLPRIPIFMQYAAEHIGSNYGAFASDHHVMVASNIGCARDFGFEQLSTISDPFRETQGFGGEVEYVRDGVPRCEHPPLAESRDLSQLAEPDPMHSTRMKDRVDAVAEYAQRWSGEYSILGWVEGPAAEAADLRTPVNFLMDLLDDEAWCCELMDRCVEVAIAFARAQIEAGADSIGVGDAIASQISPDMYDRLVAPREENIFRAIRDGGAHVRLHICGNITKILPRIAELSVDILDVDHMVSMTAARDAVGEKMALAGNIDPVEVLQKTPQYIRDHVRRTYESVGRPFFVNAGCEIPPNTPVANVKALCEPIEP